MQGWVLLGAAVWAPAFWRCRLGASLFGDGRFGAQRWSIFFLLIT